MTASCQPRLRVVSADAGQQRRAEEPSDATALAPAASLAAALASALDDLIPQITSLSARVPPREVEAEISGALRRLIGLVGFDRGWIAQFDESDGELRVVSSATLRPDIAFIRGMSLSAQMPWYANELHRGRTVMRCASTGDVPVEARAELTAWASQGVLGGLGIPINVRGRIVGAIGFDSLEGRPGWPPQLITRLRAIGHVLFQGLQRSESEARLAAALGQIKACREQADEHTGSPCGELSPGVQTVAPGDVLVTHSDRFKAVVEDVKQVALTDTTVLLVGETGTGKELLTRAIHDLSPRRERPMVTVNCAALPSTLIEAELFGREKGAYTGALARQQGRFELADGSTIFLDEIGDLPLELQAKLLRVLQEGEFERLGGTKTIRSNARVIAATNRDLAQAVNEGSFRDDLYYRLNVFPIEVPPLRHRREDILMLAWTFVAEFNRSMGRCVEKIDPSSVDALQRYPWPGNIRELRNTIERAMILSRERTLRIALAPRPAVGRRASPPAADGERLLIMQTLEACHWRIRGLWGAAAALNIKPTTLESRMKRLGIARSPRMPDPRRDPPARF